MYTLSYFQGYKTKNEVMVSQSPLPEHTIDIWRLLSDFDCHTVIRLNPVTEDAPVSKYSLSLSLSLWYLSFSQELPLGVIKLSMLTHTFPHKPRRKSKVIICNHQADSLAHCMCGLMSDLVICKFRKVWSYMTPNVLTETGVINQ